jgi:hypothetical protein
MCGLVMRLSILGRVVLRLQRREGSSAAVQVSLLHYSSGIIAILVELEAGEDSWLIAFDVTQQGHKRGRLRLCSQLQSTSHLFVCHNGVYLFYGTHSSRARHGYYQWAIQVIVAGHDIGQHLCFEIFQDHLYAVSSWVYCAERGGDRDKEVSEFD